MRFVRRAEKALTLVSLGAICAATIGLAPIAHAQSSAHPYSNTVNTRFATVSSGPQGAVIVDVGGRATVAEQQAAISRAARIEWQGRTRALATQVSRLERSGLLKPKDVLPFSSLIITRKAGRLVVPPMGKRVSRAFGGGSLTFRYTGFNATDAELLRGFVDLAYPRLVALYGQPAQSAEIEIVNAGNLANSTIPETQRFAYGSYDVTNNRILLPIFSNPVGTLEALLLNMAHAFHGPAVFQYDAWEQGFARAATSVVLRDPVFNQQYGISDPTASLLISSLRYYDLENQPPLGNSTFFPPSQTNIAIDGKFTIGKMLLPRMSMSGAAWLKVYIENTSFFRQFNEAYYSQFDPATNAGLAGNVPQLRALAAPLLPQGVEGLAWDDWYTRQYVLDTAISPSAKLYAFVVPGQRDTSDNTSRQRNSVTLVYYRTERNGDETLLGGRAFATYTDASNARLSLGAGSEVTGIVEGEGTEITAVTTNTPGVDATRVTMDFTADNTSARAYLPAGFDGDFQGVLLLDGGAKTVSVAQTTVLPAGSRNASGNVEASGFGINLGTTDGELSKVTVTVSDGANLRTFRINTGDGGYYAILRDGVKGGGVVTLSRTFPTNDGIAGNIPYLVSLPLQPLATNTATALSLPGTEFLLSFWKPTQSTYETFQPDQPSVGALLPGRGYWLKLIPANGAPTSTVTLTGTPPPTDTDFAIPCNYGWNLVGSPFQTSIDLNTVYVKTLQNTAIPWQDAVDLSLVAAQPFLWNHDTRQYTASSSLVGSDWQGYWLRVLTPDGVTLLLPAPDAPSRSRSRALVPLRTRKATRPDWSVRLRAAQNGSDKAIEATSVTLGAASGASRALDTLDQELPPAILPALDMEFANSDLKGAGGRYVADFRDTAGANRGTWNVQVTAPTAGPVTLTWEGLSGLPRTTGLTLIDSATGERVSLRNRSNYTFKATAGAHRSFQVVAEAALSLPLSINNVLTVPSRAVGASGVRIAYSVTRAAEMTLQVSTIGGKVVSLVSRSRAASAGQQQLVWDGKATNGSALPPGPYLLTLSARADTGETATTQRIVTLLQ